MSYDTAIIVDRSRKTKKKINNLENRITQQESTSKSLLNKSYELEAELLNKRNSDVMSSRLQQQWEDHLRDVTDEVRSLNKDVAQLRNELMIRDQTEAESFEQQQQQTGATKAGVADLRGRVVRCDSSIAQLASELRRLNTSVGSESDKMMKITESSLQKSREIENNMEMLSRRMDKLMNEQEGRLLKVEGTSNLHIEGVDSRVKSVVEDVRVSMESNRKWNESERARIEQQLYNLIEMNNSNIRARQESFEGKILEKLKDVERLIERNRDEIKSCREGIADGEKMQKKLLDRLAH